MAQNLQQTAADKPNAFNELVGIWAPSTAGCEAVLGDNPPSPSVGKFFGAIGICPKGMEMLYQPVSCTARDLGKKTDTLEIAAACRLKDYDPIPLRIRISIKDQNVISFSKEDFDPNYFTLEGSYRRCNHTYKCMSLTETHDENEQNEKVTTNHSSVPEADNSVKNPLPPTKQLSAFFGTWVDAAQYTCRSFDESEGEWFRLSSGMLQEGYGNACKVRMSLDGPTLIAEGNECFGEELPLESIRRTFTLSEGEVIVSNNIVYIKCGDK